MPPAPINIRSKGQDHRAKSAKALLLAARILEQQCSTAWLFLFIPSYSRLQLGDRMVGVSCASLVTYLLCLKMACQDDDDDGEETEDEEQAEHDCALVESAGELMPTLVKLISGPTFVPYFNELLPDLIKRLVRHVSVLISVAVTYIT